jgi:transposase-like protein
MATPARLVKLSCPHCAATHWVIDNDYRGADLLGQRELDYDERTYACPHCGQQGPGFRVQMKTPVSLTLDAPRLFDILARLLRAR